MADRWYKLGRTILYGALEDEAPFQTVRRLVEYEDYAARVLRDAGIPTAESYGIVEITPEREYILVTSFLDGAEEMGDAAIDYDVIDDGLTLVRKLWDAGLAHRDIKPANLLVRDGKVYLIDPFFVQVRPSPWRQAVDLANMMLVLAVRFDPDRVYERALKYFTADEIAEAFAATRGVASPTQLRAAMKADGRDLIKRFRELAPERQRVVIQRWSARRIGLAALVMAAFGFAATQLIGLLSPVQELPIAASAECGTSSTVLVIAQAVPSAKWVPCVASLPSGWSFGEATVHNGRGRFSLDSDRAGSRAVVVTLTATCSAVRESENVRVDRFPGGCVTVEEKFDRGSARTLRDELSRSLDYTARAGLVDHVEDEFGLKLCGREVSCPG
jgi:tRNA A-37 threonylcarbamoyl transferase component Bud32